MNRHGDWPMFVPEDWTRCIAEHCIFVSPHWHNDDEDTRFDCTERWELYEGVSAPLEYCGCEQSGCDMCEDDDG